MTRVLLVDTNFSSIPIYQSLIEGGHEVYVAGKNPNDALAKISKNYAEIDYSNTDFGLLMDDENCVMLSYQDCEYAAYRPKFCPECGRKLSDKDD